MLVTVRQILTKFATTYPIVEVNSSLGTFEAVWVDARPELATYDVEFGIEETLVWGENVEVSLENTYQIVSSDSGVILQGEIEDLADDALYLRVASAIVVLSTQILPVQVGDFIRIKVQHLYLYDTNS